MGIVLVSITVLFVAAVLVVVSIAGASATARKREAEIKLAEEEAIRRMEEAADRLTVTGEPLVCLNCNVRFAGPIEDTGCPRCHLSSFVVSERKAQDAESTGQEESLGQ
jgi:hypothetical protein